MIIIRKLIYIRPKTSLIDKAFYSRSIDEFMTDYKEILTKTPGKGLERGFL